MRAHTRTHTAHTHTHTQTRTCRPPPRQGVSENIILGQLCPLGTGAFDLLLNEDDLELAHDLLAME